MHNEVIIQAVLSALSNLDIQDSKLKVEDMLFPYWGIKKKAIDVYIENVSKMDISPEEKAGLILGTKKTIKKLNNQQKIANIAVENAKNGTDFSHASGVDEDWLDRFMDSASYVSDEEVQIIWGKILANEFEKPGETPPNMIRILSEMTSSMAKAFSAVCNMTCVLFSIDPNGEFTRASDKIIVPFDNPDFMKKTGVSFELLNELESEGLIKFDSLFGFITSVNLNEEGLYVACENMVYDIESVEGEGLPIGNVVLTKTGESLKKVIEQNPMEGYCKLIEDYFKEKKVEFKYSNEYKLVIDDNKKKIMKTEE